MTSSPTLSVIVVNWNVRDVLRDCLHSLQEQMLMPPGAWELVVVDNDSRDGSVEMMRKEFPAAVLLANRENLGFGKANNQAFRICRGQYVLLLNPDTVVLDHAVDRMMEIMEVRRDVAALGCRLLNADASLQHWTGGHPPSLPNVICHFLFINRLLPAKILPRPLYLQREPTQDLDVGWVSGACMLLRKEALGEEIFDERFFLYGEDLDLCTRLVRTGWKVVYTPRAQIVHLDGRSIEGQSSEIQACKLRNLRRLFAASHGRASLLLYDVVVAVGFLIRFVAFGVAAVLRPGRGYGARAAKSRQFQTEAFRVLMGR